MGYNVQIVTSNQVMSHNISGGGQIIGGGSGVNTTTATRTIQITDSVTGNPVPGNGLSVTYSHIYQNSQTGQNIQQNITVQIQGSSYQIYNGVISSNDSSTGRQYVYETDGIVSVNLATQTGVGTTPPPPNDLTLLTPTVVDESITGASDGSVTVNYTGSNSPFSVSINGGTFQANATIFPGLTGGTYTFVVKDSQGYTRSETVTVNTAASILVSGPERYDNPSFACYWNASHNPIYFTFQRPAAFASQSYYKVRVYVTFANPLTAIMQTVTLDVTPNSSGQSKCDISALLRSLVSTTDFFGYNAESYNDTNLCVPYTVAYSQSYQGYQGPIITIPHTYYVILAAFQIQEAYGGNFFQYLPTTESGHVAKFLTEFETPILNNTFPFDLSFINSEYFTSIGLSYILKTYDINGSLINAGVTTQNYLGQSVPSGFPCALSPGPALTRINLTMVYPANVYSIGVTLGYNPGTGFIAVTEEQIVKVNQVCTDIPVYVRWIQAKGGWAYYLFGYNQEITLEIQNMQLTKQYVTNYELAIGAEKIVSKQAGRKVTVHATGIPINDILGLEGMHLSPEVQILVAPDPFTEAYRWKRIIVNMGSYQTRETRWDAYDISFTYNEPSINTITQ